MRNSKLALLPHVIPIVAPLLNWALCWGLSANVYADPTPLIINWCLMWVLGTLLALGASRQWSPPHKLTYHLYPVVGLVIAMGPPLIFLLRANQFAHSPGYNPAWYNDMGTVLMDVIFAAIASLMGWAVATVLSVRQIIQLKREASEVSQPRTFKSHFIITVVGGVLILASILLLVIWLGLVMDPSFLVWPIFFAGAGLGLVGYGIRASKKGSASAKVGAAEKQDA